MRARDVKKEGRSGGLHTKSERSSTHVEVRLLDDSSMAQPKRVIGRIHRTPWCAMIKLGKQLYNRLPLPDSTKGAAVRLEAWREERESTVYAP